MKRLLSALGFSALLLWTIVVHQYHMGVLPPPTLESVEHGEGQWISRDEAGINQLILKGTPYMRGLRAGQLTQKLLDLQEGELISRLRAWIPNDAILQLAIGGLILYFNGVDKFLAADDLQEMYGTSQSAPASYDYLTDGYTRQLAYHGLHEVGQMMVDRGIDMGCTVAAVPAGRGWILGRNFDFEAGRIFDSEKILKWVFPADGFAHVSVIWAGMVGLVTGVNEKGVYISINAGGSEGFRRIGTPSTLVVYRVLKEAANTEQAIQILRAAQMFITDIFVVMDASGRLVRVEKSPQKFEVIEANGEQPFVVTNHLIGKAFHRDKTNEFRKKELTSIARETRAFELANAISPSASSQVKTLKMLELLRDKGRDEHDRPLHLGHRRAIDALIATHSVILDSSRGLLYVSQGPSLAGPFLSYDLPKSFRQQTPVRARDLPRDPLVSDQLYEQFKNASRSIHEAGMLVREKKCADARAALEGLSELAKTQESYHHILGDTHNCLGQTDAAAKHWRIALDLIPAYAGTRRDLEKKLAQ